MEWRVQPVGPLADVVAFEQSIGDLAAATAAVGSAVGGQQQVALRRHQAGEARQRVAVVADAVRQDDGSPRGPAGAEQSAAKDAAIGNGNCGLYG